MKSVEREAIRAAAGRLFMPSQTLKMPSVMVSMAKYSTAPNSEIVSISTRASPATMAGRASGSATWRKRLRPESIPISNRAAGVSMNAVRAIM